MYIAGDEEIEAIAAAIREKALFRYGVGNECERFEQRYAGYLGGGISPSPPAAATPWPRP
jgi:hypothetical protein